MPFKAMHLLSPELQKAYYHRQRQDTHGPDLVEVPIPNFDQLDSPSHHPSKISLREYAFQMSNEKVPIKLDIDKGTKHQDTVFRVHRSLKDAAKERIGKWLHQYMDVTICWSPDQECGASVFNLDSASKLLTNKFAQAAQDYLAYFPALQISQRPTEAKKPNAWQPKGNLATGPPTNIIDDGHTVATTTSSVTNSSKVTGDLQSLRKNIRKVAFSHKHLEAAFVENFMDVEETELCMLAAFNNYRERVERLEMARQRQSAINSLHIKLTQDPATSSRDGTADKLLALIFQDNARVREDRVFSETEIPSPSLPEHAEQIRTEAKKNKAHFAQLLKSENIPEGKPLEFGDLTEFEVASDDNSEEMLRLTDVDMMDNTDAQTHGEVYSIPEEDPEIEGSESPSPEESSQNNATESILDEISLTPETSQGETSLAKAAKMDKSGTITTPIGVSISQLSEREASKHNEWVTLPNKRSPRPHGSPERESKTQRKGSPQKSPCISSTQENRYSPLLDHVQVIDLMDCENTEINTGVVSDNQSMDLEVSGYKTDHTSNCSSRPGVLSSYNGALDRI